MRPLLPHEVLTGGTYWAPWGESGWSAVVVQKQGRVRGSVARVNPRTLEVAPTKGKARLDELLPRDPKQKGADRPAGTPEEVLWDVRAHRVKKTPKPPEDETPAAEAPLKVRSSPGERDERAARALALVDDQSTEEDW